MDDVDFGVIIAAIVTGFTGIGALVISFQELDLKREEYQLGERRFSVEQSAADRDEREMQLKERAELMPRCEWVRQVYSAARSQSTVSRRAVQVIDALTAIRMQECARALGRA